MDTFDHLVAAAEAHVAGRLPVGLQFATSNGKQWNVTADATDGEKVLLAPAKGGVCYPVAYVLGEGREAIIRTSRLGAS